VKVKFIVTEWGSTTIRAERNTYEEAQAWVEEECEHPRELSILRFQIHKVFTNET